MFAPAVPFTILLTWPLRFRRVALSLFTPPQVSAVFSLLGVLGITIVLLSVVVLTAGLILGK